MKFNTSYNKTPREEREQFEGPWEPSKTEQAGVVSPKKQIERLIRAGHTLREFRARGGYEFESEEDIPDDYVDPTRSPGYDIADAAEAAAELAARVAERQAQQPTEEEAQPEVEVEEENEPEK